MENAQLNTSHEYMQDLPLTDKVLVCVACGYKRKILEKETKRCNPHYVGANSGWEKES